ncbi:MAG: amidohydrolase family protein, partial [Isosphaeraceae bacterium]
MGRGRRTGLDWRWRGLAIGLGVMVMVGLGLAADDPTTELGSGRYPAAYAIRGAKVVAAPGKVVEPGTVVIRRGVIEAVGPDKDVAVPFDAETIDGKGLVVYPGFIDLYTTVGQHAGIERSATGRGRLVDLSESPLASTPTDNRRGLTPEFQVAGALDLNDALAEPRRRLGFTDFLSAPAGAIATGQSALVSLTGLPRRDAIVASPVALHINPAPPFEPAGPSTKSDTPPAFFPGRRRMGEAAGPIENPYPRVLMGSIAHLRQAMLDAEHLEKLEAFAAEHGGPTPPFDPALKVLAAARAKKLPVWWEANSEDEIHRALDLAGEFGTTAVIVGGREAGKVADRLRAGKTPVILRLSVPEEPKVPTEAEYRKKPAAERDEPLRAIAHRRDKWKEQLATAAVLAKQGIPFALATDGVTRLEDVPANLRKLIGQGLRPDDALAALTTHAAAIAGVAKRLGTIEPGKLGHVVVMTAPFNEERAKVKFVLVDGLKFEIKPEDARAKGKGAGGRGGRPGGGPASEKSSEEDQPDETAPPARKAAAAPGAQKGQTGPAGKPGEEKDRQALLQKIDAIQKEKDASQETIQKLKARLAEIQKEETKSKAETTHPQPETARAQTPGNRSIKSKRARAEEPKKSAARSETSKKAETPFVDDATELDSDRKPSIQTSGSVLIKDATILTVTHGTI